MKDASNAKWPENMVAEGPVRNINPCPDEPDICTVAVGGVFIHGLNFNEVEAKGYQIRHLPEMVALLKQMADKRCCIGEYYQDSARDILRKIGEIE